MTWPQRTPASIRALPVVGSTRTPVIRAVLISTPPSAAVVSPCPVAWTATGQSWSAANRTAWWTSRPVIAPTTTEGRGCRDV